MQQHVQESALERKQFVGLAEMSGKLKTELQIKNLRLETIIGLKDSERTTKRPVIINVLLQLDCNGGSFPDSIDSTIDYSLVRDKILRRVEGSEFRLIETLAHDILNYLITDARISSVVLEVDKPGALRHAESVSIRLDWRRRNGGSDLAD
jgi:FolB domain-containing protein